MEKWKLLSSKLLLDSHWLRLHQNSYELPKEKRVIPEYYITESADSAICVCFTGSHFVIVKQYRPAIDKFTLCHPGGRLEKEDESPVSGALRELLEETGYVPNETVSLGCFAQIPGVTTARVHIFLVYCGPLSLENKSIDETEELETMLMLPDDLKKIIESGDMDCVTCVAASYRAFQYIGMV